MERRRIAVFAEEVDGLVLSSPLAGHLALDFCNTLVGWDLPAPALDFLATYDHLAVWTAAVGLIDEDAAVRLRRTARRRPDEAGAVLHDAGELRAALYSVCLNPRPGREWRRVAADTAEASSAGTLELRGSRAEWVLPERVGLRLPLLAVAGSATSLLTSDDLPRVRMCGGRECGWLFLDRTGRRRWCTMTTCGNRNKARRFAERRRAAGLGVKEAGQNGRGTARWGPADSAARRGARS
jgi:predicted RNA-binding Zn ribbon-like protein